jgi:hypothetical protein
MVVEKTIWRTRAQFGDVVGIIIWIAWIILMMILISIVNTSKETDRFLMSPLAIWLIFGTLLVFLTLGRKLFPMDRSSEAIKRNWKNLFFSLLLFVGWSIVLSAGSSSFSSLNSYAGTAIGFLISYLGLIIVNKRFVY